MAVSRKVERELIRAQFLEAVASYLTSLDNEVLRVKSNEIALPVVGCEGNEDFLVITFKVPTGANKGTEPYDGYAEAESYELAQKVKAEKAQATAEAKAKKAKRDAEIRKRKAEISAKREGWPLFFIVNFAVNKIIIMSTAGRPLIDPRADRPASSNF